MIRHCIVIAFTLSIATPSAIAQDSSDIDQIRAARADYNDAIARHDVSAIVSFLDEEYQVTTSLGQLLQDRTVRPLRGAISSIVERTCRTCAHPNRLRSARSIPSQQNWAPGSERGRRIREKFEREGATQQCGARSMGCGKSGRSFSWHFIAPEPAAPD